MNLIVLSYHSSFKKLCSWDNWAMQIDNPLLKKFYLFHIRALLNFMTAHPGCLLLMAHGGIG